MRIVGALAAAGLLALALGCGNEGEGEKLGRKFDDAMDKVEKSAEDLGDELEDAAEELEKRVD